MPARYALYYAPPQDSTFWQKASQWIGRDSATGEDLAMPEAIDVPPSRLWAMTQSPRRYGFHATLKAPMWLTPGHDQDDLFTALQRFCGRTAPVPVGRLVPRMLGGFLALMPETQGDALADFAANCVADFDALRAPMTAAERERRLQSGLTPRQTALLDQYGYPYVMDEFRMHMTLSDQLPTAEHAAMLAAAEGWFGPVLADPVTIDQISVFAEAEPGAPFARIADFPLLGSA